MTLVVNLFAGPGAGKSTTAAGTFFELKQMGVNCELVPEYAKDVVWARTTATLDNQLYVFAKQHHRFFRLQDQVDVIVTDSPLLMMLHYGRSKSKAYQDLVLEEFSALNNHNILLHRVKAFNPAGRLQTEDEAVAIDRHLKRILEDNQVPYDNVTADRSAPGIIAGEVFERLRREAA